MFEAGRILVLGTGYVASSYLRSLHYLGLRPMVLSRAWFDYNDLWELARFMECSKTQLLINAAGFTGRTVDDCENNRAEVYEANIRLARVAATAAAMSGAALVHLSSGCIFHGPGPWKEEDEPNNFEQVYSVSKIAAENVVLGCGGRAWIFRIRMPYGSVVHPRNWLVKLANYPLILDGLNSTTFLDEFTMRSYQLIQKAPPGIYHAAAPTGVRTSEVAQMLLDAGIRKMPVSLWQGDEFSKTHVRRSECVLDSSKFEKIYGTPFGDPLCAIRWCIKQFKLPKQSRPEQDALHETTSVHLHHHPGHRD